MLLDEYHVEIFDASTAVLLGVVKAVINLIYLFTQWLNVHFSSLPLVIRRNCGPQSFDLPVCSSAHLTQHTLDPVVDLLALQKVMISNVNL